MNRIIDRGLAKIMIETYLDSNSSLSADKKMALKNMIKSFVGCHYEIARNVIEAYATALKSVN